jgi:hypothetical protein
MACSDISPTFLRSYQRTVRSPLYKVEERYFIRNEKKVKNTEGKCWRKVKINLSLCLINYASRHEYIWVSGGIAPPFLISALDGSEWSASSLGRFIAGEITTDTNCIGDWVDLQSRSWHCGEEKTSWPCRELNPCCSTRNLSLYRLANLDLMQKKDGRKNKNKEKK